MKKGVGKCKKRFFREPLRSQVGRELCAKGADVYRAEQARLKMKQGDPEPPTLPSSKVLWNAKLEVLNSQYLDSDPIKAIEILKHTSMKGTIHSIGHSPFFVHFWANHQTQLYLHLARNGPVSVSIDATGGIFRKITFHDGTESKTIFIYLIVLSIFYKAAIGLLILVRSEENANEVLKAILTVVLCETDGNIVGCEIPTQSEIQKNRLKSMMDPNEVDPYKVEIDETSTEPSLNRPESDSIFENEDNAGTNYWSCWGNKIKEQVLEIAKSEEGNHDSAYYLPEFANKLLNHMQWFPLWSCVCRDKFGFGRIPASSASVES